MGTAIETIKAYRDGIEDWRDRAAVTAWLEADHDEEYIEQMAWSVERAPFTSLVEFRQALPCPCCDDLWWEHAPDSTLDPILGLRRTRELLREIDEPCRAKSLCHRRRIVKSACEAIDDCIQQLTYQPSGVEIDHRDWTAEARQIAASDARTEESYRLRELLRLIALRDDTIRTLTRGRAA